MALDADTRQVVAMAAGDCSEATARALWAALPAGYREGAVCHTDFRAAYAQVIPAARHRPCGKGSGRADRVRRLFGTLRQRCARLARKTLSFSKKLANHLGALWFLVRLYNASRL